MKKVIAGFVAGILVSGVMAWQVGGTLMVQEYPSPFGLEETAARIQANIQAAGWDLSGLRSPSNTIRRLGATVPNVQPRGRVHPAPRAAARARPRSAGPSRRRPR